jgi:hypothetical protein
MQRRRFSTQINAPKEIVWGILWSEENYGKWTAVFSEGSYAESDWNEGSRVRFLSPEGEGLYSEIAEKVPHDKMFFRHIGVIRNGQEQPIDDESRKWSGAIENYVLSEDDGVTTLSVDMDITDDHLSYFEQKFPEALTKVKELAEQQA